jgi:hypothetical protein
MTPDAMISITPDAMTLPTPDTMTSVTPYANKQRKAAPLRPPPKKVDKVLVALTFVLTSELMPKELAAIRKQQTRIENREMRIENRVDGSERAEGRVRLMKIRCATGDLGAATIMILVSRAWDLRNSTTCDPPPNIILTKTLCLTSAKLFLRNPGSGVGPVPIPSAYNCSRPMDVDI